MEYDVFISCKSEDYELAEEIYNFLNENDIHTFLASKELRRMGDSEYRRAISKALKCSYHMIVFASNPEYVDSDWVYYEWDWFVIAKLKQKKQGQIITILKDVDIDDINPDLWKYENMTFDGYKSSLMSYVETPAFVNRKAEAKQKALQEAKRLKKAEEERKLRDLIKQEITEKTAEYYRHSSNLDAFSLKIIEKLKQLGNTKKKCPVCESDVAIESKYCDKCGWTFSPVIDINPTGDEKHLFLSRGIWMSLNESDKIKSKNQSLEENIKEMDIKNCKLKNDFDILIKDRTELNKELLTLQKELASLIKELETRKKGFESQLLINREECSKLSKNVQTLNIELNNKNGVIEALRSKLTVSEDNCKKISAELKIYKDNEERKEKGEVISQIISSLIRYQNREDRNKLFNVGKVNFVMIKVVGGTFQMGAENRDPDERPVHGVSLNDYYIGETQVTQALWKAVMNNNPSHFKGDDLPVESVSWFDCQEFIKKLNTMTGLNFRLPSEAEWEFAARGNMNSYKRYNDSNNIGDVAWFRNNSCGRIHPVRTKKPNELGVYNMVGNVWEWCQDWYGRYSRQSQINPIGPKHGTSRVNRGGCCCSSILFCRSSVRNYDTPESKSEYLGFRLAL